jgi:lysine-N-methylase
MKSLQAPSFEAFHCIGADCEDTCCDGWAVVVDQRTYEKYQRCGDAELKPLLEKFVTLNATGRTSDDYARITLDGSRCPALRDGLCLIQNKLGEEYLSKTCLTYPRVVNQVDEVVQRSLHLSCPEAARLVLLDPEPIRLRLEDRALDTSRVGSLVVVDTSKIGLSGKSYRYFTDIQSRVISLLQDRSAPLWKRLLTVGYGSASDSEFAQPVPRPLLQLETVLEIIVGRISSDFTARSFLNCYEQFMRGLEWTDQSSMTDLERRYTHAYSYYYAPFVAQHEYILEHYLVNYVYKTLFPFGPQERKAESILPQDESHGSQYALVIVYYAIIKTLAIGLAALHKDAFAASHLVQVIQTVSKTFEHSSSYPRRILQMLAEKGMNNRAGMEALIAN